MWLWKVYFVLYKITPGELSDTVPYHSFENGCFYRKLSQNLDAEEEQKRS